MSQTAAQKCLHGTIHWHSLTENVTPRSCVQQWEWGLFSQFLCSQTSLSPPQWRLTPGSVQKPPELADNQKGCRLLFSHPPQHSSAEGYQDLLCFLLKWELLWHISPKRGFSPELLKFREEALKILLAYPQTQNSSCFDYFLLAIQLLADFYMGSLGFFQQHQVHFLQWPRFWYSHKFCDSDLPYLQSS